MGGNASSEKVAFVEVWFPDVLSEEQPNGYALMFVCEFVTKQSEDHYVEVLDSLFRIFNAATNNEEERNLDSWYVYQAGRSLSVGDVLVVSGKAFRCQESGWHYLTYWE